MLPTRVFLVFLSLQFLHVKGNDLNLDIIDAIKKNINWENIRDNLRNFTEETHLAGTLGAERLAHKIADKWIKAGLEDVHFKEYNALLSYPDFSNPNTMSILTASNEVIFKNTGRGKFLVPEERYSFGADVQWVAYAGNGTVAGDVVYCHYGRDSDYDELEKNGVSVNGKIALIRYGKGHRGNKVLNAQGQGAVGAILYSDPTDVALDGTNAENVFPAKKYLSSEGAQRGGVRRSRGDALSPLHPAKDDLFDYQTIEEAKTRMELPSIPVLPLGYSDTWEILSRMGGEVIPAEWQGGLNVTYRFGGGLKDGHKVKMEVRSTLQKRKISNVIGYIKGSEEPDKYVIIGNHFDAWVYGSVDPGSGTAVLAEVARSLVQTIEETGWKPKRTIMFCNWDGEEFGLIGSTEFVEEFAEILRDRAVVYLNVDNIHANETMYVATIPTMYEVSSLTSKLIDNPMENEIKEGRKTVYDTWSHALSHPYSYLPDAPMMHFPRGNSDHAPFLNFLGIPVAHISYSNKNGYGYPLYHTMHETPFLNEHIFDTNNLSVHKTVGEFLALMVYQFTELPTVPLNVAVLSNAVAQDYVPNLKEKFDLISKSHFEELDDALKQVRFLEVDAKHFQHAAHEFENSSMSSSKKNDRIMGVHDCFITPQGISGRPTFRHLLYSIDDKDTHSTSVMTAIYSKIREFEAAKTKKERIQTGRGVAFQISTLQCALKCAVNTLNDYI